MSSAVLPVQGQSHYYHRTLLLSLVPSPSFSRVGGRTALRGEGKRRAWYTLYAHALQKSHESHYKIIT